MALGSLTYEVPRARRWNTFIAGLAIDIVGILLLIVVGSRLSNTVIPQPIASNYHVTLIAPVTEPMIQPAPQPAISVPPRTVAELRTPEPLPVPAVRIEPPAPSKVEPAKPELAKVERPKVNEPKIEQPKVVASTKFSTPAQPVPPKQVQEIKTNVLDSATSEAATLRKAPREVQTGGFGDPNGVGGQGNPKPHAVTVASVGSFDLPAGPGNGNGTGGVRGVSGTIHSAGFGDGEGSRAPHVRGAGTVMPSGFSNVIAPAGDSSPQRIQKKPDLQPVEIVYKPRPVYTPEARQLRLEGEVLLEVVFTASGSLHINRVVKGLGHGLDDSALAAAQRIQFRPARRDGQPYDCAALVHMVFELAD